MKKRRRQGLAVLLAAVLFLCSGCSLDVEQFLRPPKTQGEQQAVQAALETYIRDSGQAGNRYTLCYPVEGEHTSAFVLCNTHGEPIDGAGEDAALALAFYAMSSSSNDTHINLLRREGREWISVADVVGASADILQVAFGDLDGDGTAELLTGWDTYNSRDHRLTVFSLVESLTVLSNDRVYNRLFVGKLTDDGRDSLVLLRMAGDEVTASLESVQNSALITRGQVMLDSGIQQFDKMTLCRLSDSVNGLFIDAVKGVDTVVTELIYYDNGELNAPFCNQAGRVNTVTARPAGFAMRDVDGDAMVEIPRCVLLPGHVVGDSAADYAYRTDWSVWDVATGEWQVKMLSIVNATDGYLVALDEQQKDTVTTTYDATERLLTVWDIARERPLLKLRATANKQWDEYTTLFEATDTYDGCDVWFDEEALNMDTVRYMVSKLS